MRNKTDFTKAVALLFVGFLVIGVSSCSNNAQKEETATTEYESNSIEEANRERQANTDPYLESGWRFVKNRLKSPSTATLVGYLSPNEQPTRALTNDLDWNGVELAVFEVDAQNGFGAMIRDRFYVFFRNGEPRVMMTESEVSGATMTSLRQYLSYADL